MKYPRISGRKNRIESVIKIIKNPKCQVFASLFDNWMTNNNCPMKSARSNNIQKNNGNE
jgi:hypothetical protein